MGHVLSWSMERSGCPRTVDSWFVREVIYSFHMPLFMFMSGYVIDLKKKEWNGNTCSKALTSRLRSLLLPCLSFKLLGCVATFMVSGSVVITGDCPWFLRALFEIVLVFTAIKYFVYKLGWQGGYVEAACLALGYCFIFGLTRVFRSTILDEWINFTQFQIMYPYFILGYLYRKIEKKLNGNLLYTLMIVVYALAFYYYLYVQTPNGLHALLRYVLAMSGIYVVYQLALGICQKENTFVKIFTYLGIHSIEIYLLSDFFIPRSGKIAQMIYETSLIPNEYLATSIGLQLLFGVIISVYCVCCCLMIMKVIEKSSVLGLIFFGRKRI